MYVETVFTQIPSMNDVYYFFREKSIYVAKAMKNRCSLEFIHGVFLTKRAAIYKILIKPCVRNLIQCYSVEEDKAYDD